MMLPEEKEMELLEVYDLTRSYRDTAELCGVDHHTVARVVAGRAVVEEITEEPAVCSKVAGAFIDKVGEWIDRSGGRVRADVVHDKLTSMGYRGSERTTRRVVAVLKKAYGRQHHRVYKPWITEPGGWLQYDFGAGPVLEGVSVVLFCAWLAWSRFRVIIPLADRSLPSVIAALDRSFRLAGGAPTYVLTDNERTVTDRHIAGIAVRNRTAVDLSRYYLLTELQGTNEQVKAYVLDPPLVYVVLVDSRSHERRAGNSLAGFGYGCCASSRPACCH